VLQAYSLGSPVQYLASLKLTPKGVVFCSSSSFLSAGLENFEMFLYNTSVLYSLLVAYALVQALVLTLMLCSFIQRW